jgi:Ni,Fe-hydrogenase III large subunit
MSDLFVPFPNASAVPWADVPVSAPGDLASGLAGALERGWRLVSYFAVPDGSAFALVAVAASDAENTLAVARSGPVAGGFPSITPAHPQAHLFEREIHEQSGLVPEGHPWLKPVRASGPDGAPQDLDFFRVAGPEVHEVAVGPVHAGIIEPGHFRFQCAGEEVLHLEIALGYQHRGVETALRDGPHRASLVQIEAVSGDATAAHATAHAMALEALAGTEAPLRAQWVRAVALELERLACHTGDMGALAGDVAFLPTASANGKIRGDFLNLTARICGNRFGRALVVPGGCRCDIEPGRASEILDGLESSLSDVARSNAWFWDAASVRARLEGIGCVPPESAVDLGLVGVAARACGLVRDVRFDHPAGWHRFAQAPVAVWPGGDVCARARVRSLEIERSGALLREMLGDAPDGGVRERPPAPAPDTFAVALVEGWRGEVCHAVLTGPDRRFRVCKITDPSFHNWSGLALALRGAHISDFPICNKSFNLSYCGFDL